MSLKNIDDFTNKIIHGDCMEIMKQMPKESIDLLVADPPYNLSVYGKTEQGLYQDDCGVERYARVRKDFGHWDKFSYGGYWRFMKDWLFEAIRVMKPQAWGYIFFTYSKIGLLHRLYRDFGLYPKNTLTWCKSTPAPQIKKRNWVSATEAISVFSKSQTGIRHFLGQRDMRNYIITPNKVIYGQTSHPTEKPEKLVSLVIRASSDQGDIVLDPFLGSGTTAIAALSLKRRFVGIEQEPGYVRTAQRRVTNRFNN